MSLERRKEIMNEMTSNMGSLKNRLKETWSAGDYGRIAKNLEPGATAFLSRIPIEPGTLVLDVACGAGQVAFPAARAGARVTGIDIAPNLIEQARQRAEAEGIKIQFDEGDAEQLPYEDGSFDLVISLIGAMFAPRPDRVAAELMRVCRPGGRIVMGNWTPEGFVGSMFMTVGRHVPPPDLMPSPLQWGEDVVVRNRLQDGSTNLRLQRQMVTFRYPLSPAEVVEFFRTYFGPIRQAFGKLDAIGQAALRQDLEQLWTTNNRATDGTTHVEAEILEVVAFRN
jgi:2-polyprenyl-3-methyl-5-hydroxy-6-metoxy-1,4-benzoquinol methylase